MGGLRAFSGLRLKYVLPIAMPTRQGKRVGYDCVNENVKRGNPCM